MSRENAVSDCGCNHACPWASNCSDGWGLANHPLAMVYSPCQGFHSLYDPDTALKRGTLFTELDLPLEVVGGGNNTVCGGCARSANKRRG
ncbi:MAG: spore coat associated protein CotJA [Clostridia bacterium]|nr:spore coat associated protein CotJA [Clostridia bacterium]